MAGLVNGIYKICDALQPVILAILVLMIIIAGINTIVGGADERGRLKETVKYVLIGSAIAFGASVLGKEISTWFM